MDDCNTCTCDESGKLARCTAMACEQIDHHVDSVSTTESPVEGQKAPKGSCEPGTTWKDDCNTCFCSENGFAACTLMGCIHSSHRLKRQTGSSSDKKSNNAAPLTTTSKPNSNVVPKIQPSLQPSSIPTSNDGKQKSNNLEAKIESSSIRNDYKKSDKVYTSEDLEDPNFKCTPSESFKVDCNTCWCAVDGKHPRYCTRIACKPKAYAPLPSPAPKAL
jgi:hypothetical protein